MPIYCTLCDQRAKFGYQGHSPDRCGTHKEDRINLRCPRCSICGKGAKFAYQGHRPDRCSKHKEDRINIRNKNCVHNKYNCFDCNPLDLLKNNCRARIRQILPECGNCEELLGITDYQTILDYINKQRTPDMTHINYGNKNNQWSIDHIIPIMYNNPTEQEIKERFHYSNLQPIFQNNQKHNMIRTEDIKILTNNWELLSPALKKQFHKINNNDHLVYKIMAHKEKIKLILKTK